MLSNPETNQCFEEKGVCIKVEKSVFCRRLGVISIIKVSGKGVILKKKNNPDQYIFTPSEGAGQSHHNSSFHVFGGLDL